MTNLNSYPVLLLMVILLIGCSKNKEQTKNAQKIKSPATEETTPAKTAKHEQLVDRQKTIEQKVIVREDKRSLEKYYKLDHIKEFYDWQEMTYTPLPEMNYPDDLSTLSYGDLRLLRNEIFARNGYLFKDGFLRGYFNRYKWYMPIFDVDSFQIVLNKSEQDLINKVLLEEKKRREIKTVPLNNLNLYNEDLVVNYKQFREFPLAIKDDLHGRNFSIVAANWAMPFYVYDKNAYQYIPHYITTDLYLFILHKYFSRFIEKLDQNFMSDHLHKILLQASEENYQLNKSGRRRPYNEWLATYLSLASFTIGDSLADVPLKFMSVFRKEKELISQSHGQPLFIDDTLVNYAELKPRGHYTKNKTLKNYFKCFKWISQNGINIDKNDELSGFVTLAYIIKNNPGLHTLFKAYIATMRKLAGPEDNLSLSDIIKILPDKDINDLLSNNTLNSIRERLRNINKERIYKVFGESWDTDERYITRAFFISSTYSIGAEIFSKLVHVDLDKSKRPFPRGLDIPAVFGNTTAQDIIINEYKDTQKWPEYISRLEILGKQFKYYNEWEENYGAKGLQTALAASNENENYPDYMKTDAYNRKELSTTLSSWTHIKHDLILYQEKPYAAEAGQGGGPEPPQHYSYVEPNLEFWDMAMQLVNWLNMMTRYDDSFKNELNRIKSVGKMLQTIATKQITGEEITDEEYNNLHYIGGTIEYILLSLLETDHLPDREKSMALIADVYVYNNNNLNVAVGNADEIYVIVPIRGEYYVARGAVFSYYEFIGKIYNDEEWRNLLDSNSQPDRPQWLKPIITKTQNPEGQMVFRYPGHWDY